jgi:hypothetical protein
VENLGDLLVLVFVAWSVLGGLLGRRKGQPTPPARNRPAPHPMPRREDRGMQVEDDVAPATLDPRAPDPAAELPASILVPDDLWEILTGERRTPQPAPIPAGGADAHDEADFEEVESYDDVAYDTVEVARRERRSYDDDAIFEERPSREEAPKVVSLEDPPAPMPIRHAAFHRRLESLGPDRPQVVRNAVSPAALRSLRRAIVLREVLGPPKGLEDGGPIR